MGDQWHYQRGGKQVGPVSGSELKQLAASGQLSPADIVWKDGMAAWVPASSLKGLFSSNPDLLPMPVPPSAGTDYGDGDNYGRTSSGGARVGSSRAIDAITANELGISSTMLGGITLVGQLYPLLGAAVAAAAPGATLMLVVFLLLSLFAGFLGGFGLNTAIRKGQAGATYCVVGICVSFLALITSILMLVAVSGTRRNGIF